MCAYTISERNAGTKVSFGNFIDRKLHIAVILSMLFSSVHDSFSQCKEKLPKNGGGLNVVN